MTAGKTRNMIKYLKNHLSISIVFTIIIVALALMGCSGNGGNKKLNFVSTGDDTGGSNPNTNTGDNGSGGGNSAADVIAAQAGLEKIVFHVGPIDLPGNTRPEQFLDRPLSMRFQLDTPMWVIGFEPKVIDADGAKLPAKLLHRALLINKHETNSLCPQSNDGNPFAVASSLLTNVDFPEGYGYPVLPSDPIEAEVILQNPDETSYINVFFEITILAKPMNEFVALKDVHPIYVDFDPCTNEPLAIKPGDFSEESVSHSLDEGGSLVFAHGVLQDYGVAVSLKMDDEVEPFWRARARLNETHSIVDLENNPFEDPAGLPLKKGSELTLSASYDNFSKSWIEAASAGAMIYLARDE